MAGEVYKSTVAGVNDSYPGESIDGPKTAGAIRPKIPGLPCLSLANPVAERLPKLPSKIKDACYRAPTQQEVDAYIDSLEREVLRSREDLPEQVGRKDKWAAPNKKRPSNFFTLVWWLMVIAAGCLLGLTSIILKALT